MKKILIALTIAISCLGISRVHAENLQLTLDSSYNDYKSTIGEENINNILNNVLNEYKNNYMTSYPYYFIQIRFNTLSSLGFTDNGSFFIKLYYFSDIPTFHWSVGTSPGIGVSLMYLTFNDYEGMIARQYDIYENGNFVFDSTYNKISDLPDSIIYMDSVYNPKIYEYRPTNYYMSNFDLYMPSIDSSLKQYSNGFIFKYDNILIPTLDDSNLSSFVSLDSDTHLIEPYYLYDTGVDVSIPNIEEINLNDYAYVILSLKNYEVEPFKTTIQVKGQFCPTPVYRLGTASSEEVFGTGVKDICTPYYDTYTPYSLSYYSDYLEKFAMLYVKAYDTTKDNYIKVNTSIFDITYVSEEEKDSPLVHYQGNTIQTIPYDKLPSTSTLNTQIGYVPDYGNSFSFDDIFTQPLKFLTSVWTTIVSFFSLITSFIALLPPELRGFLFASFSLGIALGIIKIIL